MNVVPPRFHSYKGVRRPLPAFKTNSANTWWRYRATSSELFIIHAPFFYFLSSETRRAAAITADGPLNRLPAFDLLGGDALSLSPPGLCACARVWPPQSTRSHNFSSALLSSGCRFAAGSCWLPSFSCFVSLLEVWPHQTLRTDDAHIFALQVASNVSLCLLFILRADPWLGSKLAKNMCLFSCL